MDGPYKVSGTGVNDSCPRDPLFSSTGVSYKGGGGCTRARSRHAVALRLRRPPGGPHLHGIETGASEERERPGFSDSVVFRYKWLFWTMVFLRNESRAADSSVSPKWSKRVHFPAKPGVPDAPKSVEDFRTPDSCLRDCPRSIPEGSNLGRSDPQTLQYGVFEAVYNGI